MADLLKFGILLLPTTSRMRCKKRKELPNAGPSFKPQDESSSYTCAKTRPRAHHCHYSAWEFELTCTGERERERDIYIYVKGPTSALLKVIKKPDASKCRTCVLIHEKAMHSASGLYRHAQCNEN